MDERIRLYQLAQTHAQAGDLATAERCYEEALACGAPDAFAHAVLAQTQQGRGRLAEAATNYRAALRLHPDLFPAVANLGIVLRALGDAHGAEQFLRQAAAMQPDSADVCCNLGLLLSETGRAEEALALLRRALALRPEFPEAAYNLANALAGLSRYDEAQSAYRTAIALRPDYHDAHWNLAHVLLLRGEWAAGWEAFEHRWRVEQLRALARSYDAPLWNGQELAGKTIFLHHEQGFGDTIQFVRYAPLLARRGARVLLEAQPQLRRLFSSLEGVAQLLGRDDPRPAFDYHCPVMSLARGFGTRPDTAPANIPYLAAPAEDRARWRARLGRASGLRVGLVWSSPAAAAGQGPAQAHKANRSISLDLLQPLMRLPGIELIGMQTGPGSASLPEAGAMATIRNLGSEVGDFADNAALIEEIDLLVTIDTAAAHLGGALGKRTWVLLASQADWRWLSGRADTPWYPSVRLFRQPAPGDWPAAIGQLVDALRPELARGARPAS